MWNDNVDLLVTTPPISTPLRRIPRIYGRNNLRQFSAELPSLRANVKKTRAACRRHQIDTTTDEISPPLTDGEDVPDPVGEALTTGIGATVVPQGLQGKIRTIFSKKFTQRGKGFKRKTGTSRWMLLGMGTA